MDSAAIKDHQRRGLREIPAKLLFPRIQVSSPSLIDEGIDITRWNCMKPDLLLLLRP